MSRHCKTLWNKGRTSIHGLATMSRALCETSSLTAESRINFLQGVKCFIGNNQYKNLEYLKYAGYGYKYYKTIDGIDVLKNKHRASLGYVSTRSYQSEQLKNLEKSLGKRITVSI